MNCELLLVPDGIYIGNFHPFVVMALNMLIFDKIERQRYGLSIQRIRLKMLNIIQTRTFRKADGIIYSSKYAQKLISNYLCTHNISSNFIYYGKSSKFSGILHSQKQISGYNQNNPIRILYVSIIDVYKHQWNVVEAVTNLYNQGIPIKLILVGSAGYKPAFNKLNKAINKHDPEKKIVDLLGFINDNQLMEQYKNADIFIFASTCETGSLILLEAMPAGLPIASSNYASNPEILGDASIYFDPLDVKDIEHTIKKLILSTQLRKSLSEKALKKSQKFSWEKYSEHTINFLKEVSEKTNKQ